MAKIDWQDVAKRQMSPTRCRVLETIATSPEPLSATKIAPKVGKSLSHTSYHVRKLAEAGLLKLVREEPSRGSMARYYVYAGNQKAT